MSDGKEDVLANARRQEAAWFLRWVRSQRRDEGKKGGPKDGWETDALERALQLIAEHYGLER